MPGIFISYRREDAAGHAGRIFDRLKKRFWRDKVFLDVTIEPGVDFVKEIECSVSSCDVLLAIIGRQWLTCTDQAGTRRLDNPMDFVRLEIATALRRDIRVIPVLLDGAAMPSEGDLPDDIKALTRRQAITISHAHWDPAIRQMIETLAKGSLGSRSRRLWVLAAAIPLVLAVAMFTWPPYRNVVSDPADKSFNKAADRLYMADHKLGAVQRNPSDQHDGGVKEQDPPRGASVASESTVNHVVAGQQALAAPTMHKNGNKPSGGTNTKFILELQSCDEYKQAQRNRGDPWNVACNQVTEKGYYWEVKKEQAVAPYGAEGLVPIRGYPVCNRKHINEKGRTWAWHRTSDEDGWGVVAVDFCRKLPVGSPQYPCTVDKQGQPILEHYANHTGVYEATCRKIPVVNQRDVGASAH